MIKNKITSPFLKIAVTYLKNKICPKSNIKIKYFINQSKYYRPQVPVEQFLNQSRIEYNPSASNVIRLKYCPFCKKPHHNEPTNLYTLNVNK